MSDRQEHWFDRLSARHTRRGALKAAIAGGAALTLPLTRTAPALADDPHACQKGCAWTAGQRYRSAISSCNYVNVGVFNLEFFGLTVASSLYAFGIATGKAAVRASRCADAALLQQKAAYYDCIQPNCPGFDPTASGGPCDTCTPPNICCPDPNVVQGYSCCTAPPAGCCKSDGCHSGVTDCGG